VSRRPRRGTTARAASCSCAPRGPDLQLLVDLQAAQSKYYDRGVATYVKELTRALHQRGRVDGMLLNPHLPFPRALDQDLLTSPLLRWNTQSEVRSIVEAGTGPVAFHLSAPFEVSLWSEGDLPAHLLRTGIPVVATLFDLIPLVLADRYLADPTFERRYRARVEQLHQMDLILAISEFTRRDGIRLLDLPPEKIVNVGAGVSPFFRPAGPGDAPDHVLRRHVPQVRGRYAFMVAGGDPRKNVEGLLRAWAALPVAVRRSHQLVLTCTLDPGTRDRWLAAAGEAGLEEGELVLTGWVPDDVQRALYQRCSLYVHPSLYEGSWLPAGEAVACGAALITSASTVLPEVLDWPDSTFDPADVADMARAIERGLTDTAFNAALRARGAERVGELTWDRVAERTLAALDRLPEPSPTARRLPTRLAVVGPMPPTVSGIADYNDRLVRALAGRCDVDVFSPGSRLARPDLPSVRWFPPRALKDTCSPWSYDAVVYTVGNSDDHHDLYDLAQEFPGLLWLHDVRLPGLYLTYAEDRVATRDLGDRFLRERLERQYRRRLPEELSRGVGTAWTHWTEHGLGLTKELVDVARGVVVSSALAERLLRVDQGPDAKHTPSWTVPLASPAPWGDDRARVGGGQPLLVALGLVSPVKGAELLVSMLGELRSSGVDAHLAFVGPAPADYDAHLRSVVDAAGLRAHVTFTGRIGDEEYGDWLARATISLQLRESTNGESSAAITDCLAAGLPTVTNVAAATELPDGVVELVPFAVDANELAARVAALVADPARLRALAAAGRAHATAWSFDDVATRLLEIVRALP
jgi:glycosyltransferase involved in cell wall biosynthesis